MKKQKLRTKKYVKDIVKVETKKGSGVYWNKEIYGKKYAGFQKNTILNPYAISNATQKQKEYLNKTHGTFIRSSLKKTLKSIALFNPLLEKQVNRTLSKLDKTNFTGYDKYDKIKKFIDKNKIFQNVPIAEHKLKGENYKQLSEKVGFISQKTGKFIQGKTKKAQKKRDIRSADINFNAEKAFYESVNNRGFILDIIDNMTEDGFEGSMYLYNSVLQKLNGLGIGWAIDLIFENISPISGYGAGARAHFKLSQRGWRVLDKMINEASTGDSRALLKYKRSYRKTE